MTNTLFDTLIAPHIGDPAPFLTLDDASTVTFDAFTRRAAQIAQVLTDAGVRPGDRVVVQAPKCAEFIALYAACLQAGAVFLPLNTAYTKAEVRYFIDDADPALVVCAPDDLNDITAISAPRPVLTLDAAGQGTLSRRADAATALNAPVPRGPDDLAGLLYTSGTTGRSKGAMMSHRNLLSNAQALTDLWQITDEDRLIHALPVFHTHGLFVAINTALLAGAQVRLMGGFDLDAILTELPRSTLMMGVPTFYTRLLSDPRLTREATSNMRLFISGSAPLLAETHTAFEDRTGHRILERYGMTETNMITSNPYNGARVAGTVGMALPGVEVRLRSDGLPNPAGEIGTLEVRGANVFRGYWNMPDKTAEDMTDDGFFITGDLATMDAEGRVTIVGRAKDLIISGGYNMYPKEVEDILNTVPGVLESAVFGVPDADLGEVTVAAVVPTDPAAPPQEKALTQAVAAALARFKHPRRYVILPALPRNTMGKVQKTQLRADHGGQV